MSKIEEVKRKITELVKNPPKSTYASTLGGTYEDTDWFKVEAEIGQICQLFESKPEDGEAETRKSLAEEHGITFPNAEEAIKWLKSKPDKNWLLTPEEIELGIAEAERLSQTHKPHPRFEKEEYLLEIQVAKTASIVAKEKDTECQARVERIAKPHQVKYDLDSGIFPNT